MAIYNEILSARFARMLQRIFSMKGEQAVKQLAGELMPVIPMFTGVENRYLEGWQRYCATINLSAGGAGNFGKWRFRNANRNNLAVFEKIILSNTNAAAVTYQVALAGAVTTDLATPISNVNTQLDLRGPNASSLNLSFETTNVQLSGVAVFQGQIAAGQNLDVILFEDQELLLANGNVGGAALHISTLSSNVILLGSVIWRERQLEESEQGP